MDSNLSFKKPILQHTHMHTYTHRHQSKLYFFQPSSDQHAGVEDTHSNCATCLGPGCQLDFCVHDSGSAFYVMLDVHGCVHSLRVIVLTFFCFINHIVGVSHYKPSY